eukprot:TRINITY_DN51076_c0_g1_i1.p1 TRINITY_DN51076_c0_g1~~TRINITY_DN51076_c0_g1_i1.p1  ORF type:complete len:527 (+),score=93.69 TRINITY_DN51076_c0_g1_i1:135-1715(+)
MRSVFAFHLIAGAHLACQATRAVRVGETLGTDLYQERENLTKSEFFDQPPVVGSLVAIYNTVNNIVAIIGNVEELQLIHKQKLTGNIMKDLESLYAIHDLLVEKLEVKHKLYSLETYTPEELNDNYKLERKIGFGTGFRTFEDTGPLGNDAKCVHEIKEIINLLRHTLEKLELESYRLTRQLTQTTMTSEDLDPTFEIDMGCDGDNIEPAKLKGFHREVPAQDAEHCRELPTSFSAKESQTECVRKCLSIEGCAGFTWIDGRDEDRIVDASARCCFRAKISNRYKQEETACFVAAPARFLALDVDGVGDWLEKHGFEKFRNNSAEMELNGLALQALTEPKLKQYLSAGKVQMTKEEATSLKCHVDAEFVGVDVVQCADPGVLARYSKAQGYVDPFIFFGIKSGRGAFKSRNWIGGATARILSWASKIIPSGGSVYKNAAEKIAGLIGTGLDATYLYGSTNTLLDQAFIAESVSPLEIASSASFLIKWASTRPWNDCDVVYGMLMKENLWAQVEKYVTGPSKIDMLA